MDRAGGERRWESVLRRDRRVDGAFWYGVRTTGVFCRPSCPSRLPRRENVVFFPTVREALESGFRPCRRCRPDAGPGTEPHLEAIVAACRRIEEAGEPIPLGALAAPAGISAFHFHRVFRRIVGVTPKAYAGECRARRFREELGRGIPVTRAMYDAGFGSSSRLYESTGDRLGMTPSLYRTGAAGVPIRYGLARISLGWLIAAATDRGFCAIALGDSPEALVGQLRKMFPRADLREGDRKFAGWIARAAALVESPGTAPGLPLDIRGTAFQRRVWEALRAIPAGESASYAEVARRIGRPGSARAVARACASNLLAVAVPCHRAVRKDGRPGEYRWGAARKRALLEREAAQAGGNPGGRPRVRAPR
ncbi:MAG TPA: bifunctional DNA-binding transcriptional regulator/O6-methylguanine-DNA methyltransferase Ada [Candidatus Deferrimicrobiaceae bacterium]